MAPRPGAKPPQSQGDAPKMIRNPGAKKAIANPPQQPAQTSTQLAFYVLFASHIVAALYSPIQDCDEVFNFWEPTHYLNHGHGFQTWEYSPVYAIRSWTYTGLHSIITLIAGFVPFPAPTKVVEFYALRIFLAFLCALCETRLFSKLQGCLNSRIAVFYLLITVSSPGLYHASISYLPSSFSMYFTALGMAAFMDWRKGPRTAQGIACFGIGACLGWPFGAALSVPFLLEELVLASHSIESIKDLTFRVIDGVVRTLLVLFVQVGADWFFYKKLTLVPLNIVWYNIFSSKGPELYGVEPWHFYLRNLALNFHVWLPLALLSLPLAIVRQRLRVKGATRTSDLRLIVTLLPLYLWLAIFTLQPHKEERFMYPAYPALAMNAAISMHIILANLGSTDPKDTISRIPVQLRFFVILSFVTTAMVLAALRTFGTITAFQAPLAIYKPLHKPSVAGAGDNVCLGKEWYRFPSHYLLPPGVHAKFIKSEFAGLLPGEFSEAEGFGLTPGTWLVPSGMNDENREDLGKYTDLRRCAFIVDAHLPSTTPSALEPSYVHDAQAWERVHCLPFLDAASTGLIGRLAWIPDWPFVPPRFRRVWGEYCLLKRRPKRDAGLPASIEKLL